MKTTSRALIALLISQQIVWLPQAHAAPPAGSAYFNDRDKEVAYVQDATSEGVNQLNSILCFVKSMGGADLINQGNYVALIDESVCDSESRSDAGKSSANNDGESAPQYVRALVNATRDTNDDPMVIKAWVSISAGNGTPATVYARVTATEAPSTSNPYGVFRMDYCGKTPALPGCIFNGFIDASASGIQYFEREAVPGQSRDRALKLNRSGETGSGALNDAPSGGGGKTFTFAYDDQYFRRSDGTVDQCFSRDRNDTGVRESVWRYGLYDATSGTRIDRNGGFPVKYTSGTTTHQGYVGYYGMHFPGGVNVPDGATITKQSFAANDAGQTYTLVKAGGKLMKFEKNQTTLDGIKNVRFNFGAFNGHVPGTANTQGKQLEAYWDGSKFVVTGEFSCGQNGCKTQSYDTAVEVSNNNGWIAQYGNGLFGFSQSLGGEVFVKFNQAAPNATTEVFYRTQTAVYPDDMGAIGTLHCLRDCPDASSLGSYDPTNGSSSPFIGSTVNQFAPTSATISYTLNSTTGNLERSGSAVTYDGETGGQYRHGIRSGKLVPAANLADIACFNGSPNYCEHRTNQLDTFYMWETGPNPWNQFSGLKDGSGDFLTFDAPLQVTFNVPNDPTQYGPSADSRVVLQYNGFGNLFGIPGHCVSPLNNQQVSCGAEKARYVAAFSIPFDDTIGRVTTANGTPYLVGALEREIRLARKNLGVCTTRPGLGTLPAATGLPSAADLKNPASASDATYIGEPPTITDAPRVVQGVVKY